MKRLTNSKIITFRAAYSLEGYKGIKPGNVYRYSPPSLMGPDLGWTPLPDQYKLYRVIALAKDSQEFPMVVYQPIGECDDQIYVAHLDEFLAFKHKD